MLLGTLLDGGEDLGLALLGLGQLLVELLLSSLLLGSLLGSLSLAHLQNFLVVRAGSLLDAANLLLSLGLSSGHLLLDDVDAALALGTLLA